MYQTFGEKVIYKDPFVVMVDDSGCWKGGRGSDIGAQTVTAFALFE